MTTVSDIHERVLTDETPDEDGVSNVQMVGFCQRYLPGVAAESGEALPVTDLDLTLIYPYQEIYASKPSNNRLLAWLYLTRLQIEFFVDLEDHSLGDKTANIIMQTYCGKWETMFDELLLAQHHHKEVKHLWLN